MLYVSVAFNVDELNKPHNSCHQCKILEKIKFKSCFLLKKKIDKGVKKAKNINFFSASIKKISASRVVRISAFC